MSWLSYVKAIYIMSVNKINMILSASLKISELQKSSERIVVEFRNVPTTQNRDVYDGIEISITNSSNQDLTIKDIYIEYCDIKEEARIHNESLPKKLSHSDSIEFVMTPSRIEGSVNDFSHICSGDLNLVFPLSC